MKTILCFVLIALFGFIGFGISSNYLKRKRFFYDLKLFTESIKSQIGFSRIKLELLLHDQINGYHSNDFENLLKNYLLLLKECGDDDTLFKNITILTEQEKQTIFAFFKNLGKMDVKNQLNSIEMFDNIIQTHYLLANEESKKYGMLYTKLGILFGAFLTLLII